jgi:hypothetical protein
MSTEASEPASAMKCTCDGCGAELTNPWPEGMIVIWRGMSSCASCSPYGKQTFQGWHLDKPKLREFRRDELLAIKAAS